MADLYKQLKDYERREAQKFPTSGTIARVDGKVIDVQVGTTIYRNVRVVGSVSSTGQVVILTWEDGIPTAHTTDGSTPSSVALIRGPQGAQGPAGPAGAAGAQGPQGLPGTTWYAVDEEPDPSLGNNGDLALDILTGDVYQKTGGAWAYDGNLKGIQGIPGPQGDPGATGAQGPTGPAGSMASATFGELVEQSSAPAAPAAGSLRFYAKTDHKIYQKNSTGTESAVGVTDHTQLQNIGTNTHVQIDTHIAATKGSNAHNMREVLTAARTYYVRTDGNDANDGLSNTAGGAFRTVQKAINTIAALDLSVYNATIQIADGTYNEALTVGGAWVGAGMVTIQGNAVTPANVVINATGAAFTIAKAKTTIKDLKIQSTTIGVQPYLAAEVYLTNVVFGACTSSHIRVTQGAFCQITSNYSIVGAAAVHWDTRSGAEFQCIGKTITITGTPAFGTAFATAKYASDQQISGNTFVGSATGKRYDVTLNGIIDSAGATLPGNAAGTTASGGQYI